MQAIALNFTKAAIGELALPPKDAQGKSTRATYLDKKVPGLQLRVTSSGIKTWSVYRWFKGSGKPERVTLGKFPDISIEQARTKAQRVLAALAEGNNPNDVIRKQRAELSFAHLFELYVERHAKPRKRTWQQDVSTFRQYLTSNHRGIDLAARQISTIDRSQIALLHSKLGKAHPTTANRVLALVRSIYSRAIEWGIFDRQNPASGIKAFPEKSRQRFLQASELPRFFAAVAREPNATVRDFFILALLTGARRSNLLSMRWEDIDPEQREWHIPATQSKNGVAQTVALPHEALDILIHRKADFKAPYVFVGRHGESHLKEPQKAWNRLLDWDELTQLTRLLASNGHTVDAGEGSPVQSLHRARELAQSLALDTSGCRMKDLRIHDLRRTMGSWQAKTGASLVIIGKSLGHKSLAATQVYAHLDRDPVREAVTKATKAMLDAAAPRRIRAHG